MQSKYLVKIFKIDLMNRRGPSPTRAALLYQNRRSDRKEIKIELLDEYVRIILIHLQLSKEEI